MKKGLLIAGIALAAYGLYVAYKKKATTSDKKNDCGCNEPKIVKQKPAELYPDAALEHYDASFRALANTPTGRLGQGPLPIHDTESLSTLTLD